ncbi:MAG: TonB-dependent receptor [Bacteroidales bacterium]|nr:TonB-dependent receptor [Bacteroidales bacterium]
MSCSIVFNSFGANANLGTSKERGVVLEFYDTNLKVQDKRITGRVLDEEGSSIIGAKVVELGRESTNGTITDSEGLFNLTVSDNSIIRISYIGFLSQDINTTGETNFQIVLKEDRKTLDEVVVIGYGTQKKSHLTGAVSTINTEENLQSRPVSDIGRAIQGASPGLSISVPSGEVGVDPIIKIRGQIGSFQGSTSPLILLDNVEVPSLQFINPDDVESISVLKDAAAVSIYGAKAAFGVILITTKKGKGKDKIEVKYSNNFSFQNPWKKIEMAGSNGIRYNLDAWLRNGRDLITLRFAQNQESYERILEWEQKYGGKLGVDDPMVYGRDWYVDPATGRKFGVRLYDPADYLLKEWAPTQQHNLSVSGTSGKTFYNIGIGTLDQSGMMKPAKVDKYKRRNFSLRINSKVNKFFTARAGAMFTVSDKLYPFTTSNTSGTDVWYWIYRWNMLFPHGNYETGEPVRGPWYETMQANTGSRKTNFMNVNIGGTLVFNPNWKLEFDYDYTNRENIHTQPGTKYTARDINVVAGDLRFDDDGNEVYVNKDGEVVESSDPDAMRAYDLPLITYRLPSGDPNYMRRSHSNSYRHTINTYTTYDFTFDDLHVFKFLLGLNSVTYDSSSQWSRVDELIDVVNPQFNFAVGLQTAGGGASWQSQLGYFSRVNYTLNDKYLLEANIRYDGSSKFPGKLKWRWFPSFSAGWIVSHEDFMQWALPVMNFLKLRMSWGTIGDQTVPSSLYLPTMSISESLWIGADGQKAVRVGTPSPVSANVTWQDITTLNFGADLRFWANRLGISFDWYQRDTENMIVPSPGVSTTYGAAAPLGNFGSLRTRGWELELDFNHRFQNGLRLNLRGSLSDAKTVITKYGTTKSIDSWYVGKTYGEIWGYETDRLFQYDDFVLDDEGQPQLITLTEDESALYAGRRTYWLKNGPNGEKPVYQAGLQRGTNFFFGPGDVKFVDLDGDGEISPGNRLIDDHGDLKIIGNSTPRYLYGLRVGLDYKSIDFSVFLQGVGSRQLRREGRLTVPGFSPSEGAVPAAIADDYWTEDNPNAFYPAAAHNGESSTINNMQVQTRYLLDMSYLRLKNVTLGYSIPSKLLKKIGLNSFRVYSSLENFFTLDNLGRLPVDPEEIPSVLGSGFVSNYALGVKPPLFKSASIGLQLNL